LAVRQVTGKDPEAYFSDYRNRNNVRMQEVKEAIGVEARTTIFNPAFIKEQMKGGASSADNFAETVRNTYGWNVMKPKAIDNELWDKLYQVYVQDEYKLGVKEFFEQANPASLQEMTAVMLETARKGYWKASAEQLKNVSQLHTQLVTTYKAACTEFVCDNAKLRTFITNNVDAQQATAYQNGISAAREAGTRNGQAMVLKKDQQSPSTSAENTQSTDNHIVLWIAGAVALVALLLIARWRNKK